MNQKSRFAEELFRAAAVLAVISSAGCSSTRLSDTSRTGVEQLLVSRAIDSSLDKIEFDGLANTAVFVDEKYLECVDKKYIVGSVRQRAFRAGARLVDKPDEADIVLELYCGAVGTDRSEGYLGVPALSLPGPLPVQLPEIKLISQTTQYGTAKIGIVSYDAKTRSAQSAGGLVRSRSNNSNWSVLGVGPFNSGAVREELALARAADDSGTRVSVRDRATPVHQVRADASEGSLPSAGGQPALPSPGAIRPASWLNWPADRINQLFR